MKRTTSFFVRVALVAVALALAVVFVGREASSPAEATSFDPINSVTVTDPTPGAHSDLIVSFSLEVPDAFPNLTNRPAIQFIPGQWGINPDPPLGGASGTFNVLVNLGIFGVGPCNMQLPLNFDMFDSTADTGYDPATGTYDPEKLASALDLGKGKGPGGTDIHPMGAGFSGQFVDDPNQATYPSDYGLKLIKFNANEKWADPQPWQWSFRAESGMYIDVVQDSNKVSAGDVRLQVSVPLSGQFAAGSVVAAGDPDVGWTMHTFGAWAYQRHDEGVALNAQMDPGEHVYNDNDVSGAVSDGDQRLFVFEDQPFNSTVEVAALTGGISRYPDFLNLLLYPEVVGDPLARQFGQTNVLGNPVSLNLVTFRPGQLEPLDPRLDASLGYPTVVVILNPKQLGQDPVFLTITNDMCTPLALVSTNLGFSQDNPETPLVDESGVPRLTNPPKEKDYKFTLVVESQPDAEDADGDGYPEGDGIENLLDTCPLDANIKDLDSRSGVPLGFSNPGNPDGDGIDAACDPLEFPPADWGAALVAFNADEKATAQQLGNEFNTAIYRDLTAPFGRVSVGDDRLYHPTLAPGKVQVGNSDINRWLYSFAQAWEDYKHAENVAANGLYDPGENVYNDRDHSGDVGHDENSADGRMIFEGSMVDTAGWEVGYPGSSAFDPSGFLATGDEDQDNYSDRGDNCAVVANGVEVLNIESVPLRFVNFYLITRGDDIGPSDQTDTDGDSIGDACEGSEHGAQCLNDIDDDLDGVINDGCPRDHPDDPGGYASILNFGFGESVLSGGDFGWCLDNVDNDGDGAVNDGCPPFPQYGSESGAECDNPDDDNGNGRVNEGCPTVHNTGGAAETGADCNDAEDDDGDGRMNDGCPSVDPGDVAKMTPNGHVHQFSIERTVHIAKHGIKLNKLGGPKTLNSPGARNYSVDVSNLSDTDSEDIQVALRVVPAGCATVSGPSSVSVGPGGSGTASFTVDWTGCDPGPYTLQADACHAGDPASPGFFGSGACPGVSDGKTDPNPLDDTYIDKSVTVGP